MAISLGRLECITIQFCVIFWECLSYRMINAKFWAPLVVRRVGVKKPHLPSLDSTSQGLNPTGFSRNNPEISKLLELLWFSIGRENIVHIKKKPQTQKPSYPLYLVPLNYYMSSFFGVLLIKMRSNYWKVTAFVKLYSV